MHLEAAIERVRRCTWRPRSCEFQDAIGIRDRASLGIHLEAMIERVWRPKSSEFGDALAGPDQARLVEY